MELNDYTGVVHFHSQYSFDGRVHLSKIIPAAEKCGIDFLMLTDHNHLRARDDGWEGWHGNVLLIVGEEISPRFNHYLAFNIKEAVDNPEDANGIPPQSYINKVNSAGGLGIIAHPDHEGTKTFHVKHYPWTDWSVDGYSGISIWDFMTDWQSSLNGYLLSFFSYFFPAFFLRGPRQITLDRWDSLNQKKKIFGIGELDNHASLKKVCGITIEAFSFERAFRFVHTHILAEEPFSQNSQKDINSLLSALQHGRCYAAMEYFHNSRGFHFSITHNNKEHFMGDSFILSDKAELSVTVPKKSLIRVIKNSNVIAEEIKKDLLLTINEPGLYRVEAFIKAYGKFRPWIFSNPIFIQAMT
jgi:hypothetical protein